MGEWYIIAKLNDTTGRQGGKEWMEMIMKFNTYKEAEKEALALLEGKKRHSGLKDREYCIFFAYGKYRVDAYHRLTSYQKTHIIKSFY